MGTVLPFSPRKPREASLPALLLLPTLVVRVYLKPQWDTLSIEGSTYLSLVMHPSCAGIIEIKAHSQEELEAVAGMLRAEAESKSYKLEVHDLTTGMRALVRDFSNSDISS